MHLYPTDSGHIPRRESASASTPITSMTSITENVSNLMHFGMINNQHQRLLNKRESTTLTLDVIRDDFSNHSYSHNSIHSLKSIKRSIKEDTLNQIKASR